MDQACMPDLARVRKQLEWAPGIAQSYSSCSGVVLHVTAIPLLWGHVPFDSCSTAPGCMLEQALHVARSQWLEWAPHEAVQHAPYFACGSTPRHTSSTRGWMMGLCRLDQTLSLSLWPNPWPRPFFLDKPSRIKATKTLSSEFYWIYEQTMLSLKGSKKPRVLLTKVNFCYYGNKSNWLSTKINLSAAKEKNAEPSLFRKKCILWPVNILFSNYV